MKSNLADMCEALASELRWQEKYFQFRKSVRSAQAKKDMGKLAKLSLEKMKILYRIITDAPWEIKKI